MTFQYLLMANYKMYQKLLMKELEGTALTMGQPKILDYLCEHDGASQKEIAAACYIESASLTSALNSMEAKGMVERRRLGGNRRTYHVFLTEKGRELCERVEKAFSKLEAEAFAAMTSQQKADMDAALGSIYGVLGKMMEKKA